MLPKDSADYADIHDKAAFACKNGVL